MNAEYVCFFVAVRWTDTGNVDRIPLHVIIFQETRDKGDQTFCNI